MATYTGSGKYFAFQDGKLKVGVDNQQYGFFQAFTKKYKTQDGVTLLPYYGITSTIQALELKNLNELCIGKGIGYTGTLRMYSYYSSPYNTLIWDPESMYASSIRFTPVTYRFVNGIMVGTA